MSPQSHRKALIALLFGLLCISWSAIFTRWAGVPGVVSAFYRMVVAVVVFVPWRIVAARSSATRRPARISTVFRVAAIAALFYAGDIALFNTAIMTTSAANATLLGNNAPVFVALGGWLLFGVRPTRRFWVGFALTFAGLLAVVGADVLLHPRLGAGDAFALIAALCYAGYLLFVARARTESDPLTLNTIYTSVTAIVLLIVCLVLPYPMSGFPERTWLSLLALGLVSQVMGHLSIAYAMGRIPATQSSVVLLGQAPVTAVFAFFLLDEGLGVIQLLGGALVLAGIYVVTRESAPPAV